MRPIPPLLPVLLVASLPTTMPAQGPTGRTLQLLAPAVVGQTTSCRVESPASAAGNLYAVLSCAPPFAGTTTITAPGVTFLGTLRIDPPTSMAVATGLLGATGSAAHGFAIPNVSSLVGYAFDLQSADLETNTATVAFSDNELELTISDLPPTNMVPIPAGSFPMGSNAGPPDGVAPYYPIANERPVHAVHITRPFWIGKYEVTQAEYLAVMSHNPSYFQPPNIPSFDPNLPVEGVSWHQAMAYCAALTLQEAAASRLPSGYQYRLPTEAEWEYCCRAGTTDEFHYGPALLCSQANFDYSHHSNTFCGGVGTVTVSNYVANAWGLHQMHGNVWEWCLDSSDGSANYPATPVSDPFVTSGTRRILRGGSFVGWASYCRSARRNRRTPSTQEWSIGFRVVLAPVLP